MIGQGKELGRRGLQGYTDLRDIIPWIAGWKVSLGRRRSVIIVVSIKCPIIKTTAHSKKEL